MPCLMGSRASSAPMWTQLHGTRLVLRPPTFARMPMIFAASPAYTVLQSLLLIDAGPHGVPSLMGSRAHVNTATQHTVGSTPSNFYTQIAHISAYDLSCFPCLLGMQVLHNFLTRSLITLTSKQSIN